MIKKTLILLNLAALLSLSSGLILAADQQPTPQQQQEKIYGSQLMTPQERLAHRNKMRAAKTVEEREQIRKAHHEKMKQRAKKQGITLSDEPPARGGGMGPAPGAGRGR